MTERHQQPADQAEPTHPGQTVQPLQPGQSVQPVQPVQPGQQPPAGPCIRPLVLSAGRHPQPRRPVRSAHPATTGPRTPRHPRAACTPAPTARQGQGDLAARFAHRLIEVLTGIRPVGQLQRHTTLHGYQQLTALVRTGPLRPRGRAPRMRMGRVYDSQPVPGALEVCVRVEFGPRHHMVAFRLEQHHRTDQWQCAAVEAR